MTLWKYKLLPCFEKQVPKCKHIHNKVSVISKQLYSADAITSLMSMPLLSSTLSDITNISFSTGTFPKTMKICKNNVIV